MSLYGFCDNDLQICDYVAIRYVIKYRNFPDLAFLIAPFMSIDLYQCRTHNYKTDKQIQSTTDRTNVQQSNKSCLSRAVSLFLFVPLCDCTEI